MMVTATGRATMQRLCNTAHQSVLVFIRVSPIERTSSKAAEERKQAFCGDYQKKSRAAGAVPADDQSLIE